MCSCMIGFKGYHCEECMSGFHGEACAPCPAVGSKTDASNPIQLDNVCSNRGTLLAAPHSQRFPAHRPALALVLRAEVLQLRGRCSMLNKSVALVRPFR